VTASKFNKSSVIAGSLAVAVVLLAFYVIVYDPLAFWLPKDKELTDRFLANHSVFERLRSMSEEDSRILARISQASLKRSNLTESRREEYADLLSRLGSNIIIGTGPHQVTFHFAGGGLLLSIGSGWTKGITYLPDGYEKIGTVVDNLDKPLPQREGTYLVPIEKNWYVVYSHDD
jgi:hypothetical protein